MDFLGIICFTSIFSFFSFIAELYRLNISYHYGIIKVFLIFDNGIPVINICRRGVIFFLSQSVKKYKNFKVAYVEKVKRYRGPTVYRIVLGFVKQWSVVLFENEYELESDFQVICNELNEAVKNGKDYVLVNEIKETDKYIIVFSVLVLSTFGIPIGLSFAIEDYSFVEAITGSFYSLLICLTAIGILALISLLINYNRKIKSDKKFAKLNFSKDIESESNKINDSLIK